MFLILFYNKKFYLFYYRVRKCSHQDITKLQTWENKDSHAPTSLAREPIDSIRTLLHHVIRKNAKLESTNLKRLNSLNKR